MTRLVHSFGQPNNIRNKANAPISADPLPRLLAQLIDRAGLPATVERASSRPWASALFEGRRHVMRLSLTGQDAAGRRAKLVGGIRAAQWSLGRHFVADITVDGQGEQDGNLWVELSALTIQDW